MLPKSRSNACRMSHNISFVERPLRITYTIMTTLNKAQTAAKNIKMIFTVFFVIIKIPNSLFCHFLFKYYLSVKRRLKGAEASECLFINYAISINVLELHIICGPIILIFAA